MAELFNKEFYKKKILDEFEEDWSEFQCYLLGDDWFQTAMNLLMEINRNEVKQGQFYNVFKNSELYIQDMNPKNFNWLRHAVGYNILDDGECNLIKAVYFPKAFPELEQTEWFVTTDYMDYNKDKSEWLEELVKQHCSWCDIGKIKEMDSVPLGVDDFIAIMRAIANDNSYRMYSGPSCSALRWSNDNTFEKIMQNWKEKNRKFLEKS